MKNRIYLPTYFLIMKRIMGFLLTFLIAGSLILVILPTTMFAEKDEVTKTKYSTRKTITVDDSGGVDYTRIQDAIDNASNGDKIYVWSGIYYDNLIINKSIELIGNGSNNTIIIGNNIGNVVKILTNYVNLSGFSFRNSGSRWNDAGIYLLNAQNVTIENNNCSNNQDGIFLDNSDYNTIKNNINIINKGDGVEFDNSNFNMIVSNHISSNARGISLTSSNNNTISSNNIKNCEYGITISYSINNIIINNWCLRNKYDGIFLNGLANGNRIKDNTCSKNNKNGISLEDSNLNSITNNFIDYNRWNGIFLKASSSNTIYDNICKNNNENGIRFIEQSVANDINNNICQLNTFNGVSIEGFSNNNILWNNSFKINKNGIFISGSNYNKIKNNKLEFCGILIESKFPEHWDNDIDTTNSVNGKPVYYWKKINGGILPPNAGQVILFNCSNITIQNQDLSNGSIGILLSFSNYNKISNNVCNSNNYFGVSLYKSQFNKLINNSCNFNNYDGIRLERALANIIINNTFKSNKENGINLYYYTYLTKIIENNITFNKVYGINITESNDNIFSYNNINRNLRYGINLNLNSYNNSIHHNNFVNNNNGNYQAIDNGINNKWNTSVEGNYWSDWLTPDNNNDYIVDDPYILDGNANTKDYFPLIKKQKLIYNIPPKINHSIDDIEILEDTYVTGLINLLDWFFDPNGDSLSFNVYSTENISVIIFENNSTVLLILKKDWNGKETLTFFANDSKSNVSDDINISVLGINDPPEKPEIHEPLNEESFNIYTKINFSGSCADMDVTYGDILNFTWISNISGIFGFGKELKNILLPFGIHKITLLVSDLMNKSNSTNIIIIIYNLDTDGDGWNNSIETHCGTNPYNSSDFPKDLDDDGVPDALDFDIDGDNVTNDEDDYPYDETKWKKEKTSFEINQYLIMSAIIIILLILTYIIHIRKKQKE